MLDQAVAASRTGNLPEAARSAEMVLKLAGQAEDKALEAQCCAVLAFATFALGDGLRLDLISRALAGPAQPPRLSMELRPNVAVGHILHWIDDLGGARVLYEQEYDRARRQGAETGLPFLLWALAENEGWAGNWPRAEYLAAEGYRLAQDSGSLVAIAFMLAVRGLLHAYRGRTDAGQADAARAVELAGKLGMPLLADRGGSGLRDRGPVGGRRRGLPTRGSARSRTARSRPVWPNRRCAASSRTRSRR